MVSTLEVFRLKYLMHLMYLLTLVFQRKKTQSEVKCYRKTDFKLASLSEDLSHWTAHILCQS
jgi:hypothetical protein